MTPYFMVSKVNLVQLGNNIVIYRWVYCDNCNKKKLIEKYIICSNKRYDKYFGNFPISF